MNTQRQNTLKSAMPVQTADVANDPAAFARLRPQASVSETPFAGRIGGNQEFTVSEDNEKAREILKKQPDAVRSSCILMICCWFAVKHH